MESATLWGWLVVQVGEHGLAGFIGAMGHQVLYCGNRLRGSTQLKKRVLVFSVFYVATGSGVGHFVGVDGGSSLISLGAGFGWPMFIQSINAAKQILQRFNSGDNEPDQETPQSAGGG